MAKRSKTYNRLKPFIIETIANTRARGGATASGGSGGGAGVTDHGALTGLGDDDHTQYLLASGGRALTGNLSVNSSVTIDGVDISAHAANPDAHHDRVTVSAPLAVSTQVVSLVYASPLTVTGGTTLDVLLGDGVEDSTGIRVKLPTNSGLVRDGTGVYLAPSTVAFATSNAVSGSGHTHAVTTTSTGTVSTILALDGSGYTTAARWIATDRVRTPLIDTASGNLTLQPAGDIIVDPTGNDMLPATNYDINLGALSKKYLTLHAAELWVETLVAQDTVATIGGRILVGPTTALTRDMGTGDTTIYVKHNQMISGDRAYMEADGKVEFFAITSGATNTGSDFSYTVTRNLDGTGANQWYAGDALFNTGQAGNGFIDLYSLRGVKTSSQAGPTIVGNVRLSGTYNDWAERWAIGNLNGLYGYGVTTYGFAAGEPSATWIGAEATNGFRIMHGSTVRAELTTAGNFIIRNSAGYAVIGMDNAGDSSFAGVMTIGTGGEIRQGTGTLGTDYTGLRIWRDTNVGRIGGYNSNTLQWYAGTDGKVYAGAGNIYLDTLGVTAKTTQTFNNTSSTYPEVPGYSNLAAGSKYRFTDAAQSVWYGGSNYAAYAGGEIGSLVASSTINADPLFPNSWVTAHSVMLRLVDSPPKAEASGYPSAYLNARVGVKHGNYELGLSNTSPYYGVSGTEYTLYHSGTTSIALLTGRSGGQNLRGGTGANDDLYIESTSHATKGDILLAPNGGNVSIGNGIYAANATLEITKTGYATVGPTLRLNNTSAGAVGDATRVEFYDAGSLRAYLEWQIVSGGAAKWLFYDAANSATRMEIGGDGLVNIGAATNTYSAKLAINGNVHAYGGVVTAEDYLQVKTRSGSPGGATGFGRIYYDSGDDKLKYITSGGTVRTLSYT